VFTPKEKYRDTWEPNEAIITKSSSSVVEPSHVKQAQNQSGFSDDVEIFLGSGYVEYLDVLERWAEVLG